MTGHKRIPIRIYYLILILLYLSIFNPVFGQIKKTNYVGGETYHAKQWTVLDIVFHSNHPVKNPFEVKFGAQFRGPQNKTMHIPGFYDGKGNYILRFSPPQKGKWSFVTDSDISSLAGQEGTVLATANSAPNQHGPLEIDHKNKEYFQYEDGTKPFVMGYELDWLFALDWKHRPEIPDAKQLIDTLAAYGYNQIVMNVYAYDVSWKKDPHLPKKYDYGSPDFFPFGGTNKHPDYATLNVAFFSHLDRIIDYLRQKNITAHVMIYVWNKGVNWPAMYSKADNRYFDYVVKRYEAFPNVVWDVAKEALSYGRCDMNYVSERISRIRRLDAYQRLVTVHDYKYCNANPGKVDFISVQSWGTPVYTNMRKIKTQHPDEPILNIENGGYERGPYAVFEGDYNNPVSCLWRNYQTAFAGVYSTYYWQDTSWDVIIPDPMSLPDSLQPRYTYYKHFTSFFTKYNFSSFVPVQNVSSSGYALANNEGTYLFLIPADNSAIHISLGKDADKVQTVTWFDPLSGKFFGRHKQLIHSWQGFRLPDGHRFLILIVTQ